MYVIIGLGNPGSKYQFSRHNTGFHAIDFIAREYGIEVKKNGFKSLYGEGRIGNERVVLAKPQTFMNLSGEAAVMLCGWYKPDVRTQLIVLYDDADLAPGSIRIRQKGSAGSHNGMKSILYLLGTDEFFRVRIGIGKKPEGWDMADFVLAPAPEEERGEIGEALKNAVSAVALIIAGQAGKAQELFNNKKSAPKPPQDAPQER